MFGTQMTDEFFAVHTGGDVAFLNGVLKVLLAEGTVDRDFVRDHTDGFDDAASPSSSASRSPISSASRARPAPTWSASPGCTPTRRVGGARLVDGDHPARARRRQRRRDRQPRARARQRRPPGRRAHADPRPLRGAGRLRDGRLRHRVPRRARRSTPPTRPRSPSSTGSRSATARASPPRRWSKPAAAASSTSSTRAAATSSTCCPIPTWSTRALARVPLRVHQDIVLSSQMLVDPGEVVVLLPAATRYEQRGGGTETTTERRIVFSPEIPGPRPGEARSEWEIFVDLAPSGRDPSAPSSCSIRVGAGDPRRDRPRRPGVRGRRAARAPPATRSSGAGPDSARAGVFPTADGRARFLAGRAVRGRRAARAASCSAPGAGKQFNTMVHEQKDPLTGALRDALLHGPVRRRDARSARRRPRCVVRSDHGELPARLHASPLRPGNVQVFFPEGNVLLPRRAARPGVGRPRLQRGRHRRSRRAAVTPDDLLAVFDVAAAAQRGALATARPAPSAGPAPIARAVRARPRRRRRRAPGAARRRAAGGERGVRVDRARPTPRSPSCSIPSTARPTARAASRTGRSRCARSTPTARSPRWCRTARPVRATPRCAARARSSTGAPLAPADDHRRRARGRRALRLAADAAAAGSSSARSARPRSRCATSPPVISTATSTGTRPARAVGLPRRRCSCATRPARSSSTPTAATSCVADADARRQLVAAGTPDAARAAARTEPDGDRTTSISTRLLAAARRAAARRCRDRARRASVAREQRAHEGAGRLGERRRHRRASTRSATLLHDAAPDIAFFGEETGGERADVGWLVDPLDGTANFVHGFPAVGVSVGLVADGRPVVGVVHAPMLGRRRTPRASAAARPATASRIRSATREPDEAICATGFPFRAKRDRLPEYFPVFERALAHVRGPAPGRRREPRPRVDRGRRASTATSSRPSAPGTSPPAACWCGRPGEWSPTGRATTGPGSSRATSSRRPPPVHERILEVIAAGV